MSTCIPIGIISLKTCVPCNAIPTGFITVANNEGDTFDMFRINSGSRRVNESVLKSPLYGYLPHGEYDVSSIILHYDRRADHNDHFILINRETKTEHFLFHNNSPAFPAPGGIVVPSLNDWKRLIDVISSKIITSFSFKQ